MVRSLMPNFVRTARGIFPLVKINTKNSQRFDDFVAISPYFYVDNDEIFHARADL